ncbi:MAG TPA: histidine kinase dimerization/phosphoacceptor domain -containing protein [Allosphingosinicella sp.]|jgi:two-component sensor histidine kinase|nr:histidine kinase dimerization/phosphoacceptor domain -containing protein [Allosphingosinicella sp.]
MKRLVTIDLPRRLSRRLPKPVTELAVGIGVTAFFVGVRLAIAPLLGEIAPFALGIIAVVIAALVGGWRSGLVSMLLGTALIWFLVLPPYRSFALENSATALVLAAGAFTEGVILLALGLYQREVRAGQLERARRINFLGHALREMDHRTKNNFQIVTSLLTLQATRSASEEVRSALSEAAERLKAVAAVYDALAPSSQGLVAVRLQDQLQEICDQIRRGIMPDGIALSTELEPILVPHESAVAIGIIVNELVTNACKHAFPDGSGSIRVKAWREDGAAFIEVADDGKGFVAGAAKPGLGSRLVTVFLQRLKARSDVQSSPEGTVHRVRVPLAS